MATTVGTEGTLAQRLTHLVTLDYDAIEAYEAAKCCQNTTGPIEQEDA